MSFRIPLIIGATWFLLLIGSCKQKPAATIVKEVVQTDSTYYKEPYRPQFHFSPEKAWMNDPNGLVYYKDLYHLFYQYYPDSTVWGPMHWGHAVSKNLIAWEHKPVALYPDEHGYIFSGSAVIDHHNSSGFGTDEDPPMVAIFTYHLSEGEKAGRNDFQTQGIAYSLDNGDNWKKYEGNPVIKNPGMRDFRDPKVFWDEAQKQWVLVLVAGDHARFYRSDNLKEWHFLSEFGKDKGAHGGVWECPDLFKLKVDNNDEEKWVLLVSINPGAPNGGSGTQYFVGDFDGKTFTTEQKDVKWIDYGADNYAGITYNNIPDSKRIFMGWMSNWNYAQVTPMKIWRSAMTLPRELSLEKQGESYILKTNLIDAFDRLLQSEKRIESIDLSTPFVIKDIGLNQTEIGFRSKLSVSFTIALSNERNEQLIVGVDAVNKEFFLDRRNSGLIDFEKRFADAVHKMPYGDKEKEVDIRIILDRSSIELFIDQGRYVMTEQFFPSEPFTSLKLSSQDKVTLTDFNLYSINSIWNYE